MKALQLQPRKQPFADQTLKFDLDNKPIEEQVKLSILRDLYNLNWQIGFNDGKIEVSPPETYDKEVIKDAMSIKRNEILAVNNQWIGKNLKLARENLADGKDVLKSEKIKPRIEVCKTAIQHRLFRALRYYWSSPYSEYVGRRIKLIIRDHGLKNKPVIGIAALGSPIIHIPERDEHIGWDKETRTKNLIYAMDAYVIGALPPYNYLLGGKLVSYILASNEVREIYKRKYQDQITLIDKRKANDLVAIFTTGLYGKSSQYNRIKYDGQLLYQPFGSTKGYGTLHLTEFTVEKMRELLVSKGIEVGHKFGDGPSWRMRLIRTVGKLSGFDPDFLLKHSFRRNIYYVPLAENSIEFLKGIETKPVYYNWPVKDLTNHWRERWLENRKKNLTVLNNVLQFKAEDFKVQS